MMMMCSMNMMIIMWVIVSKVLLVEDGVHAYGDSDCNYDFRVRVSVCVCFGFCGMLQSSTSLPRGNQVDGLPRVCSNTAALLS